MAISMIAAVGKNLELGKDNDLIWHFKEDMKFFKETTMGHPVIMGRKTFESLPKALPGRKNIVISANPEYKADGAEVVTSVEEAIKLAETENTDAFVIGGGRIYNEFLPYADNLYLTEINAESPDADTYFPDFNKSDYIKEIINFYDVDGIEFYHVIYKK
ncbi:dihydrofolate reductase [Eubacterium coprostanoligenes]|uniref:Dihydrofolate reductase n=1 Tax=Eubacterium coprostanoligenes TaxID=290054 RepID=A0A1T4MJH5_9FIRM|nr:dihydrofolate reductase [Eubacterium coprostanoligenes]SJZ67093.1 dihydrofolate reductase [Eubacterium coprostanoligenes]